MSLKQKVKNNVSCMFGKSLRVKIQQHKNKNYIGSLYGGFFVCLDILPTNPIIYSFGIGEDISFDLEMLRLTNSTVYAFDPTPKSITYLKTLELPERFIFSDTAVASIDGNLSFYLPKNPAYVSGSLVTTRNVSTDTIPVKAMKVK